LTPFTSLLLVLCCYKGPRYFYSYCLLIPNVTVVNIVLGCHIAAMRLLY